MIRITKGGYAGNQASLEKALNFSKTVSAKRGPIGEGVPISHPVRVAHAGSNGSGQRPHLAQR